MQNAQNSTSESVSPYTNLPAKISSIGFPEIRPKIVSVAVLLGLLLGPAGLLYSSMKGAIVMTIVTGVLLIPLGTGTFVIILPACAFWAWRSARESQSALD
jgi:hypothetical protein